MCNRRPTGYSLRAFFLNRSLSCTACAVVSLSDTIYNHPRDALLRHHSCSHQSTGYGYVHPRDAFFYRSCNCQSIKYGLQSFKGCASLAPLVQSSVYWVRLQSSKGCLLLPLVQLSIYQIRSTIIQGMRFSSTARAVISLLGTVTIIQGMLLEVPLVQLPAYWVYSTIRFVSSPPLVQSSVLSLLGTVTIIQGMPS